MVVMGIADKCNFNCLFCLDGQIKRKGSSSLQEIKVLFKEIKKSNEDTIMLMRGESLIRPDFFEILKAAKKCKLNVYVTTNGSMLSYYDYLVKIIERGVVQINLSLHSHIPAIANAISRNSSCYSLQRKAIENIDLYNSMQKRKVKRITLNINTVVCNLNYKHLDDLVLYLKRLLKHTDFRIKFKFMVQGGVDTNIYKKLLPSLNEVRPHLSKAIGILSKKRIALSGFPLCAVPLYEGACVELQEMLYHPQVYLDSLRFKDSRTQDDVINQEFYKYKECKGCSLNSICLGVRRDYQRMNPDFNLTLSRSNPKDVLRSVKRFISEQESHGKQEAKKARKLASL